MEKKHIYKGQTWLRNRTWLRTLTYVHTDRGHHVLLTVSCVRQNVTRMWTIYIMPVHTISTRSNRAMMIFKMQTIVIYVMVNCSLAVRVKLWAMTSTCE